MLPFNPLEAAGIQPWLFNGPTSPFGLAELATPYDGPALEPVGATIAGGRAIYGVGGHGAPVLFLHAAGLSFRAYQRSLRRLTAQGYRVLAPSLPGFSGTAPLARQEAGFAGYAAWVAEFLDDVDVVDPVFVIGHAFGAGVGVQLAHDFPDRVGYLVLMGSPCTSWSTPEPLRTSLASARPPVSWVTDAWKELVPFPEGLQTITAVAGDLALNSISGGWAAAQAARLAHDADLSGELAELAASGPPLLTLANDEDAWIPDRCFQTLAGVMGPGGSDLEQTAPWVLAGPAVFEAVVKRAAQLRRRGPRRRGETTPAREVLDLLAGTDVPGPVAEALVATASPLWLLTEAPDVLATDLALCHPPLEAGEVRAAGRPLVGSSLVRLTVVAADRPGLLADTTAVLARAGYSVSAASACSWPDRELALHALTFDPGERLQPGQWEALSAQLRRLGRRSRRADPPFEPIGAATVTVNGTWPSDTVVELSAPDAVGLLWATCRWFAEHGVTIRSATVTTNYGIADDGFIVHGPVDADALAAHLSPLPPDVDRLSVDRAGADRPAAAGSAGEGRALVQSGSRL